MDQSARGPAVGFSEFVGLRREYDIICLGEPCGFSTRTVPTIRQAMCQVEMLLETGATKIGIYASQLEALPNDPSSPTAGGGSGGAQPK